MTLERIENVEKSYVCFLSKNLRISYTYRVSPESYPFGNSQYKIDIIFQDQFGSAAGPIVVKRVLNGPQKCKVVLIIGPTGPDISYGFVLRKFQKGYFLGHPVYTRTLQSFNAIHFSNGVPIRKLSLTVV